MTTQEMLFAKIVASPFDEFTAFLIGFDCFLAAAHHGEVKLVPNAQSWRDSTSRLALV